jgi:SAM-dependent methyltransferase
MTTSDLEFDSYVDTNKKLWNAWTGLHEHSRFYNLAGFMAGGLSLRPIELEELAPMVSGRSLLHLMCHFGLDTLSWARLGARVTGVDLADDAIATARRIAADSGIAARFVESDVYRVPQILDEQFDIVFSSYGVLHWLPDLRRWARTIAMLLRPGGIFYLVEDHPFMRVFSSAATDGLDLAHPYFFDREPSRGESTRSYASDGELAEALPSYTWNHGIGEVITALSAEGLAIRYVHEFDFAMRAKFSNMVRGDDGLWRLPAHLRASVPMLFSLQAVKP